MNALFYSSRRAIALFAVTAGALAAMVLAPPAARADDISDELDKIKQHADSVAQCQRTSFSCMASCSNGAPGSSCRAMCALDYSNCIQACQ